MQPDLEDANFIKGMRDMFDMNEDAVEKAIEELDSDDLATLSDAVANEDRKTAEQIIAKVNMDTGERVNSLFRGNLENEEDAPSKHAREVGDDFTYTYGDDVQVEVHDHDPTTGEVTVKHEDGTVYLPDGPHDTVGVKINGKSRMVNRKLLKKLDEQVLDEQVLGMVNLPNLERMQQLAGIQSAGVQPTIPEIAVPSADSAAEPSPCDSAQQAMDALDVVQAMLPNIRLTDLKAIRQKIIALQTSMNEGAAWGRARKL